MAPKPRGNAIHVYGGAAETIPCPFGEPFPDLPTSFILAAPTASGKTMIILNLLLRYYKDMFARIWFFSPSIKLDPQYAPLRKYLWVGSWTTSAPSARIAGSASSPSLKYASSSTTSPTAATSSRRGKVQSREAAGWSRWRPVVVTLGSLGAYLRKFST